MTVNGRLATEADFRSYYGKEPPPIWLGYVGENEDGVVCFGSIVWTAAGDALGFFDRRGDVPKVAQHRTALRVLRALREVGEKAVWVSCDDRIPRAAAWLLRLGFATVPGRPDLWKAELNERS